MSGAHPSLHKLSLRDDGTSPRRAERVGTILDDPNMPPDVPERIERLTLNRRRGPDRSNCILVQWTVGRYPDVKSLSITITMRRDNVTHEDGQLMRASVRELLAARGTPIHQSIMRYWPPPNPPVSFDARNTIGMSFLLDESATPRRGMKVDGAVALLNQAVGVFAARTDRMVVPNPPGSDQLVRRVNGFPTTSRQLKLCAITPGTPGFMGRVVAKSLQDDGGPPALDVGALSDAPATPATFAPRTEDIGPTLTFFFGPPAFYDDPFDVRHGEGAAPHDVVRTNNNADAHRFLDGLRSVNNLPARYEDAHDEGRHTTRWLAPTTWRRTSA